MGTLLEFLVREVRKSLWYGSAWSLKHFDDSRADFLRISGIYQNPEFTIAQGFPRAVYRARKYWYSACQRFRHNKAETFTRAWHYIRIRKAEVRGLFCLVDIARESHGGFNAKRAGLCLQSGTV